MDEVADTARCDVAVVGGGLAGLAAACTAARSGATVLLIEPRPLGGRARTTVVEPGVVFNGGPRALYMGGPAQRVLDELGVGPAGAKPPLGPAGAVAAGRVETFPTGGWGLARTGLLARAAGGGLGARSRVGALLAGIGRIDTSALQGLSVDDWIARRRLRGPAAALVRAVIRLATYVDAPADLAADAAVAQLQLALGPGVRYLDGGWQQLVDALADVALAAGATRHESAVRSLDRRSSASGSEWVVGLGGAEVIAASVVLAVGTPTAAAALTSADLGLGGLGEPATAACLELAVAEPPRFQLLLGIDEPLYLARHSPPADLSNGNRSIDVVHVARYGAKAAASDRAQLWAHAAAAGIVAPGVVADRFLARMTVSGGIPLAAAGGLPGRPPVEVASTPGLFLAGDWVGDEGMLGDAALASGAAAGRAAAAVAATRRPGVAP